MGTRVKNRIKMDNQILKGAAVVVLFPPKEDEITDKDFAICESISIFMEEHDKSPTPVELMDIMQMDKMSDVYKELEHLQDIGIVGLAPGYPYPVAIFRW